MKQVEINLNKKINGIVSFEVVNSATDRMKKSRGLDAANELTAEEYLKTNLNKEKILSDRIKVLEEELQRTREESFQAGYQEGKEQSAQEAKKQIDELKILIKSIEKQYAGAFAKLEMPLLRLAKKMAEKVIGIDLENSAELDSILMERLKRLLYEVIDQAKIIIEVNPEHLEWLESPGIEKELNTPKSMEINFIGDENLKPGECKIHTEEYHIDETYATKLDQLERHLLKEEG